MIRSRLDYGYIVYASAPQYLVKQLDTISNEDLWVATGAFKTTPISSLQNITNEKSLELRREELFMRYYCKMRAHLKNPAHTIAIVPNLRCLFQNKLVTPTFAIRVCEVMSKYKMTRRQVKPAFSYRLLNIRETTWSIAPPRVNVELAMYPKKETNERHYRAYFREMVEKLYADCKLVYTDGSNLGDGVGE